MVENCETRPIFGESRWLRCDGPSCLLKMDHSLGTILISVFENTQHRMRRGIVRALSQHLQKPGDIRGRASAHAGMLSTREVDCLYPPWRFRAESKVCSR